MCPPERSLWRYLKPQEKTEMLVKIFFILHSVLCWGTCSLYSSGAQTFGNVDQTPKLESRQNNYVWRECPTVISVMTEMGSSSYRRMYVGLKCINWSQAKIQTACEGAGWSWYSHHAQWNMSCSNMGWKAIQQGRSQTTATENLTNDAIWILI